MKKLMLGILGLFAPIMVLASGADQNSLYSFKESNQIVEEKLKYQRGSDSYKYCVLEWQETKVLGDFFNCINPEILIKLLLSNGERLISQDSDIAGNQFLTYTSANVFEGSKDLVMVMSENSVLSLSFSFYAKSVKMAESEMKDAKRAFVNFYGQPDKMNENINPYYYWDLNDDVKLYIKKIPDEPDAYVIQFYNEDKLKKALTQHLLD